MDQKRAVVGTLASKYRASSSRKARSQILDEVQELTGYNRHYAAWMLRNYGKHYLVKNAQGQCVELVAGERNRRHGAHRPRKYDESVKEQVVFLWDCFDQMCGKRLAAMLPDLLAGLVRRGSIETGREVYQKLQSISASTIDRMLSEERARRRVKGAAHTKPSNILKTQIPILISNELCVDHPGHYQIDLVGHDGGNPNGQFCFTFNAVELFSGWIEPRILLNKAQRWSLKALKGVCDASPMPVLSLHSDNDSAFLNEHLQTWCKGQNIRYTRARPYHSNDTCYVEQKNYNIVRQVLGYARYETEQEAELIAALYKRLRLLINFFYPSMKLLDKQRIGSRIHKTYDKPRSPFRRLLDAPSVDKTVKIKLRHAKRHLDPFALKHEIAELQEQLLKLVREKNMRIIHPGPSYPQAKEKFNKPLNPVREKNHELAR